MAGGPWDFNKTLGISDDYEFYTAADYISVYAERPSIFQNWVSNVAPFGARMSVPGLGNFPLPMEISSANTKAVKSLTRRPQYVMRRFKSAGTPVTFGARSFPVAPEFRS